MLLRAQGINANGTLPTVAVTWAQNPHVTDEILTAAVVKAKAALKRQGRADEVSVAYLEPIVVQLLDAPPQAQANGYAYGRPEKFDPVAHVNRNRTKP